MTMKEDIILLKQDALGRIIIPSQKREEMLDAFEASSMTATAFAKEHGVKPSTFATWVQKRRRFRGDYQDEAIRRKLRMPNHSNKQKKAEEKKIQATSQPPLQLVEVSLAEQHPSLSPPALQLELPNQVKISLESEAQIPLLKNLLAKISC